jgi:membrane dipeptidase
VNIRIGAALGLLVIACTPSRPQAAATSQPAPSVIPVTTSPEVVALPDAGTAQPEVAAPLTPEEKAKQLAHRFIILDGHIDLPWRLWEGRDARGKTTEDVSERTKDGDFDYPRAKEGGLDAPFMSIYVPARNEGHGAKKMADSLIDIVVGLTERAPDKFALAGNPGEVRKNAKDGKISLLMGMENGSPIEHKLTNVRHFYDRGIRYITLAHSKDNHLSDSSYDTRHKNKGLSPFGEKVVTEMNRLGMLVDVSHISDDAFEDVMRVSKSPVVASHSSCRHFTPGWARNMSDDMIKELASHDGVIQINFGSGFVDGDIQKEESKRWVEKGVFLKKHGAAFGDKKAKALLKEFDEQHPNRHAKAEQVADHIDHVVKLVGIDHVGLGSDFDGLGDTLPEGLEDVSAYPNLIRILIERGYSDADIEKICSGNVLRVWEKVDQLAQAAQHDDK